MTLSLPVDTACDRRQAIGRVGAALAVGLGANRLPRSWGDDVVPDRPLAAPSDVGVDASRLAKVVAFLDAEVAAGAIPGAAIVASRHGKLFLDEYRGTFACAAGGQQPYGRDVAGMLFSYSKGVAATVAAIVRQEGLFDFDEPVAKYIPEFGAEGKDKITTRQILTHAAGIPGIPLKPLATEKQWQAAVEAMREWKPEWPADSKTAYHALGMFVVAEVVRRVCGNEPWRDVARKRLFEPLGAASMTFGVPTDPATTALKPGMVDTLDPDKPGLLGHPAGGCFGTPRDALRVLELHLAGGVWNSRRLLTAESHAAMHTVRFEKEIATAKERGEPSAHEPWGLGWLLRGKGPSTGGHAWFGFRDQADPTVFGHAGIDTVIGVADPTKQLAMMFVTTDSPKSGEETIRLRNEATNGVLVSIET